MIRKFILKNNYLSECTYNLKAEYCSFGYYDGMDTEIVPDNDSSFSIMSVPHYVPIESIENGGEFYEKCDCFTIVGIIGSDDSTFWSDEDYPFVFLTFIRLKSRSSSLGKIMKEIEDNFNAKCYNTLDSSDLIVAMREKSYIRGCTIIERVYGKIISKFDKKNKIQKCYSVFSVNQKLLNDLDNNQNVVDETISCILNCLVNDWNETNSFIKKLESKLGEDCIRYCTLGSNDIIILINNIKIKKLFALYVSDEKKGILTHRSDLYKKAFINVNSELLVDNKEIDKCLKKLKKSFNNKEKQ